ncbi:phenylalanine--tRNA ligase subunit beta [Limnochorda pilosa]|uniref:Phenylalanine--tRNA ligase beta subunit n=1 Tax=Limnochorda pilosa TaxID=1555112 RepID=A0A0K2SMH5_LIMPI|nr:phenylalanine--tRNA ligase subunit beta [Limnochorda pilosa]BAS28333.1 phenylalanyl-tRNA synthetase subunit beta [Limnochorda pilosa]
MRLPLDWMAEYVDVAEPIESVARRLTAAGPKVEGVHRAPAGVLEQVRVARILEARPHPGSDHLWVCQVEAGDGRRQVVSGAPNTREGIRVPYAPPGTRLPETDGRGGGAREGAPATRTVEVREVRGVRSEGMLCSQAELGVGPDASGLWILPGRPPEGLALADALPLAGQVLEFEIYPNRPDCLSVLGLAREWHAVSGAPLREPRIRLEEGPSPVEERVEVIVEAPDLCPRYAARVVEGVRIAPSPPWMQERLLQAGMRPINNVVDVTNYVMLEMGQPLHAFDADRVRAGSGGKAALVVRRAREGERIVTLDGAERSLTPEMLLIAGRCQPLVIAGIMGGEEAEVHPGTSEVVLESAHFHGPSIRRTSRLLGLRSESSLRFEKGLDPDLVPLALDRAAALVAELAGGRVARGRIDVYPVPKERAWVSLSAERVNRLLGTRLAPEEMAASLRALDFEVREAPGGLRARAPVGRVDVEREADLVEEIGRLYGYDRIEPTIPASTQVGGPGTTYHGRDRIRDVLVAAGLSEAVTYSFVDPEDLRRLEVPEEDWLRLENPLSREQSVMRGSLLPGLILAARLNLSRSQYGEEGGVALFELGRVFHREAPEEERLGLLLTGRHPVRSWQGRRDVHFFDLKGLLEAVADLLGVALVLEPDAGYPYHPGQSARWVLDGSLIGRLGALHPRAQQRFDLAGRWPRPIYAAEVRVAPLVGLAGPPLARTPSTFPSVTRDLALLVPRELPAARVTETVREAGGPLLESLELFDRYQGEQVGGGRVSLAYRLSFRADRTLTDAEVNDRIRAILDALEGVGVRVR